MRSPVDRLLPVLLVAVLVACGTDSSPTAATSTTTTVPTVLQIVDEARQSLGAPGVLATVARDGKRVSVASGARDGSGEPITAHATVPIGSATKLLTAYLSLDAVERGELTLDTPVDSILPGVLHDGSAVTMRMLLDHTSGIFAVGDEGDLLADIGRLDDAAMRAEAEQLAAAFLRGEHVAPSVPLLVALAETHDRYGRPGTTFHYSNVNYLLLGSVLEAVTQESLAALLQQRMVGPMGLTTTAFAAADDPVDVRGYVVDAAGGLSDLGNAHELLRGNGASGAVTSTTAELLRFLRALVTSELLPRDLTTSMLTPSDQSDGAYGLGVASYLLSCGTFYGHAGGISGVDAIALVSPDGENGVVLVANARPADGRQRLLPIAERLACADLSLG